VTGDPGTFGLSAARITGTSGPSEWEKPVEKTGNPMGIYGNIYMGII